MLTCLMSIPAGLAFLWLARRLFVKASARSMRTLVLTALLINALVVLAAGGLIVSSSTIHAQQPEATGQESQRSQRGGLDALAAAIAVGMATLGAGIAVAVTGSAAIGGIAQNPDVFGRSLVFVGLAEGIAIYGLIIAFMILTG